MLYIYYIHFKITGNPCNLTCSQWCNLFKESTMFCSKLHLFPSQWGHLNKMPQSIVWRNQSNCTKMKKKRIETFYKPAHYRINNTFAQTTKSFIWVTELCDFKMDVINFKSCNFGLKSYLCFQIKLVLPTTLILKSRTWFQTKLHSTEFNYHYLEWEF